MSTVRYKWWSYVKWMIRLYPERTRELARMQSAPPADSPEETPGGGGMSRPTERPGAASLGRVVDREVEAVRRAVETTRDMPDGAARLRLIELVFWKASHSLSGACAACSTSERTGQRWHAEFIYEVARNFDLW